MHRTTSVTVASALLGVISAAAVIAGAFFVLGAWSMQQLPGATPVFRVGAATSALIGVLSIGLAILAGISARDVWLMRPRGVVLGLVASLVTLLAPAIALMAAITSEGSWPLLVVAAALGALTALAVLVALRHLADAPIAPTAHTSPGGSR